MKHLRRDFDTIQPWPAKRPHLVKNITTRELVDMGEEPTVPIAALGFEPVIGYDEPVFILRAQDPSAVTAVRAWADDVERRQGDPALVRAVRDWAHQMLDWQLSHAPDKKVADVPEEMLRS